MHDTHIDLITWYKCTQTHAYTGAYALIHVCIGTCPVLSFPIFKVKFLEFSQYLEKLLWPSFDAAQSTRAHILSIAVMVNEKFRERVPTWEVRVVGTEWGSPLGR